VTAEGDEPPASLVDGLVTLGVLTAGTPLPPMRPLAGGVSSEIWCLDLPSGPVVAKQALTQLRVAGTWLAPVERTGFEIAWMRVADTIVPGITPRIIAASADLGVFVMEYLDPAQHRLWKQSLLDGHADPDVARAVGERLGAIHRAAATPAVRDEFDNVALFDALRLDPYLGATARAHADLADRLGAIRGSYLDHRTTLVHGDVSPKNILVGPHGPVLIDAECATWGDPSFDLAFCATHLLLKMVAVPGARDGLRTCLTTLSDGYCSATGIGPADDIWRRASDMTAALLLARVDGLSPAEYLTPESQQLVRERARLLLADPAAALEQLADSWAASLPEPTR